jgi:hypothetical protein
MYNEEAYARRAVAGARGAGGRAAGLGDRDRRRRSTDGTAAVARPGREDLGARDPQPAEPAAGGALRAGYAAATRTRFYTDADLPVDLEVLPRAVRLLEYQQADIVAAYRFDRTSEGLVRALYTFCYNHLIRTLFGLRVRDVNFAFKLFRRSVLQKFTLTSEGSFIDAEFLLRARKAGCVIIQIGLDYFPRTRGTSTLGSVPVILAILRDMAARWRELR